MVVFTSNEEIFSDIFILDDLTPLGVNLPDDLTSCFNSGKKVTIFNASMLAKDLCSIMEDFEDPVVLNGGGVLTYTLMKREGYNANPKIIEVNRDYVFENDSKRPKIVFSIKGDMGGRKNCIDDIISSGATINQLGSELRVASLLLSSQTRNEYRMKQGSTVKNVETLFVPQRVNCKGGFPAIFSARYLVKKIEENSSYLDYASKYTDSSKLLSTVRDLNKEPFNLLYQDPNKFIRKYGE